MEQLSSCAIIVDSRVQQDGNAITSRGPGTAIDYSVALMEQLFGKEKADEWSVQLTPSKINDQFLDAELNKLQWTSRSVPKMVGRATFRVRVPWFPPDMWNEYDRILVPIADGSEEMEAIMVIDVLRRAKAEVVVASVGDKLEIVASCKVKLIADMLLDEAAKLSYDLIILPGGYDGAQAFSRSEKLVNLLKQQSESDRYYGAICGSPALVLEPLGLLKGKKATTYPARCKHLSDQSYAEYRVVVDGRLITCRGPETTLEFGLAVVEKLMGRHKALEIAKEMLVV
ncbi:protein DJ-1 homolog B-like [Rutidosis leptorrhynchoides]|uniref:protein DJ-1 homolog B-like n=1 Tax=Rutidosis leptorrhynchoides TaxID=125765 RepID=UPI003A9A003C